MTNNRLSNNPLIIGAEEWLSLPELNIPAVLARVDSGAKTSAIHAFNIHEFKKHNENWVRFEIHPLQFNRKTTIQCEARVVDTRIIKSSSGIGEQRFVIKTTVKLGEELREIEVSLTNRDSMGYRMLLGREAMQSNILVNPSKSCCLETYTDEQIHELYKESDSSHKGLKIGVLASNPDLYSNQRLIESGEERGHSMYFLDIQQCYMKLDTMFPEIRYRGGKLLNDLDAIIPRIRPSQTFYGCALLRQFESIGIYCQNNASSIQQSRDKLYSSQLFTRFGLQIPITGFAQSPLDTKDVINMVNGAPVIVKLLEGAQGKGVVLAETSKAAESVINAFKSLKAQILVQEFIKEAGGKDIRCFVIDGKVVAAIERQAVKGEFRSNLHQGGQAFPVKITSEERKLAVKAAKVLNLQVAGVDIIRSNKGPLLMEVNSSPGLEGIESVSQKNIAGEMIKSIEKTLKWS